MENFLKPYDKEYMRMAMLKHEETFKEQLHELHRLYRIQKILMRNIGNNRTSTHCQELCNFKNGISFVQNNHAHSEMQQKPKMKLDLQRPAEDYAAESSSRDRALELIDESEIELTLGLSSYHNQRRKEPETPLTSDSGPSLSSPSSGSSHINRTSSLSHQIMNTKREESGGRELGLVQVPDMTTLGGYQSENKTSIDVDEQLRQKRLKQPPWLFQALSLNMT
ncbi:hypothetical protein P3X46_018687 [Hevea brasiliensis]|uniref:SPX domain-containing protein n=1 Tax=Hevea brasiliensis TaxID=3981 RepID=A0ABQ9LUP3_HEVBR|nr:uncharacterized protein LOC110649364 [Hevea brasiliensis]KAJ9170590.1 hypothetical protein P3X46_018687 [Hevea brasiliensis]